MHRKWHRIESCAVAIVVAGWVFLGVGAGAQVGSTTDIVTGKVTGPPPSRDPIVGATVTVTSIDTHISRSRTTNSDGRYTIVFPDGGGQYRVEVRYIGYAPADMLLSRQADEDRLVANIALTRSVYQLETVTTRGRQATRGDPANAGGTGTTLTPSQIERLPIDGSDLATIATLSPGVVGLSASDTTASAFSVAGQRQSLNSTTVDGLSFGGSSVPTEAVRNIRVVTNSYDVSRGQFTGGQIATTTRGGTNDAAGSFGTTVRNSNFAFGTQGPPTFGQLRDQLQLSGGFGGPIVRDKLFTFTAVQFNRRSDDLISLLNASPSTLGPLGIGRDTADLFTNHVRSLGLPISGSNVPSTRGVTSAVAIQRFDLLLSDEETLTLRGDFRATGQDGSRVSVFSLPTVGTANSSAGGGLFLGLTSHLGDATINDLRVYAAHSQTSIAPYFQIPAGRVTVIPDVADTDEAQPLGFGVSSLAFGGSPAAPQRTFNDYVESTNEISILPGEGAHRVKLGGLINVARFGQNITPNQQGVFTYNSLAAFEADSPSTFTRNFNVRNTTAHAVNGAVYLGDAWRTGQLQLTYGARLEGSVYSGAPAFDPTIDSLFHRRTDDWPSEIHASPRVGFTYILNAPNQGGGPGGGGRGGGGGGGGGGRGGGGGGGGGGGNGFRSSPTIIRGGIGEFRAPTPQSLFSSLQSATGAAGAETQLVCVGPQVPTPDWAGYADGSATPPTECNPSSLPIFPADSLGLGARNAVTTFAPDFEAPRAWRGSLGISHRFLQKINVSIDGTYARGEALFGVTDLNLDTVPQFRLAAERNRPVFTNPTAIDPGTGGAAFGGSRLFPKYGQVLSLNSNLQSDTRQVTATANGFTDRGMLYSLAYTYSRVRDQSSFSGGSAVFGFASPTTAGNPNVQPFGTSDLQREHQFVGTVTYPVTPLIEITAVAQLNSGAPYSPTVNGDVNGDGVSRNDRAFIFDPSNPLTDPAVASAMRTLLASGPGRVRDCLESQLGNVATRNSCFGPWSTSLNWQVNIRPNALGLDRRLTISVQLLNTLTGVDLLVHGPNHLQGWGQPAAPDPTLLSVTGFNPSTDEYKYSVNTHFGRPSALQAYGQPFLFVLSGRLNVGPGNAEQQLRGFLGRGAGGGGGAGGASGAGGAAGGGAAEAKQSLADQIADRFGQRLPNPFDQILALKDTLGLSADQESKLEASSQVYKIRVDSITGAVRAELKKLGANLDATTMFGIMRRQVGGVRAVVVNAVAEAKAELSADQWERVPESIKGAGRGVGGGRGRGGGLRGDS